jgi:NADPH-dependent 2,4-dienoyl-CoA reductase/sulfur reductase-like enzyme/rhodanese-related sulfurtransferase
MKGAIISTFIREKQYHKSASRVSLTKSLRECRGILDVFCYNKVNKKSKRESVKMRIVIIGSVAAGTSVAAKARRNNIENEIVIYEKDTDISYSVCGLPYYIGEDYISRENLNPRNSEWFKKRFAIEIKTGHEVVRVDSQNKVLQIKNLVTGVIFNDHYDILVFATGAAPIRPNIEGIESENTFILRNIISADTIKEYIQKKQPASAVIVGSGFIGMEVAENLVKKGIQVAVVEAAGQVMPSYDSEMSLYIKKALIENKVQVFTSEKVVKIDAEKRTVLTDKGTILNGDIVIISAGVKPEVRLAGQAGIEMGTTGAIKVNRNMETSVKGIYAVGDCAESYFLIDGTPCYRPMGSTANKTGRIAGDVITGGNLSFRGILGTGIVKVFDITCGQTGYTEKEAKKAGYDVEIIHNIKPNQTEYFEGSSEMVIKAIADRKTERLLGVQIIGKKGVDKRIDVFATAITFGAKAGDLAHLDLAYAPPYSTTKDPVMYTGMILDNALNQGRKILTIQELIRNRTSFKVLDVRSSKDFEKGHIEGAINIPLGDLRERATELSKDEPIVVHCNKGVTGNAAQNLLINLGFTNVYNLSGGYKEYKLEV